MQEVDQLSTPMAGEAGRSNSTHSSVFCARRIKWSSEWRVCSLCRIRKWIYCFHKACYVETSYFQFCLQQFWTTLLWKCLQEQDQNIIVWVKNCKQGICATHVTKLSKGVHHACKHISYRLLVKGCIQYTHSCIELIEWSGSSLYPISL